MKKLLLLSILIPTCSLHADEIIHFAHSKITSACAPHDASSTIIAITQDKKEYPLISINWWAAPHPSATGGVFSLESKGKDPFTEGFQGFYCVQKGKCADLKKVKLKVVIDAKTKDGSVQFNVETEQHEIYKGEVPGDMKSDSPKMCG